MVRVAHEKRLRSRDTLLLHRVRARWPGEDLAATAEALLGGGVCQAEERNLTAEFTSEPHTCGFRAAGTASAEYTEVGAFLSKWVPRLRKERREREATYAASSAIEHDFVRISTSEVRGTGKPDQSIHILLINLVDLRAVAVR